MHLIHKTLLAAPLALGLGIVPAMAQDATSTGYAGDPLGLTLRSVEGAAPDHSVTCLNRASSDGFDCLFWTASGEGLTVAQVVDGGAELLGLQAVGLTFANTAVAVVLDGRGVPATKVDRIAAALDAELGRLGGASRISVRRPGQEDISFETPSVPRSALQPDTEESGRLWREIDAALDDLATFEARPRTLVVAAGEASPTRRFNALAERAADLGVRVVVVRIGGEARDGTRLSGFAEAADGAYIDLSAAEARLPRGFAASLLRGWRLAFSRTEGKQTAQTIAYRFGDAARVEFSVSDIGPSVLRIGNAPPSETLAMRVASFVPDLRLPNFLRAADGTSLWLAFIGIAGTGLLSSTFLLRRRKVAIAPVRVQMPPAETVVDEATPPATGAETEVATQLNPVAILQFVGTNRADMLTEGEVRIGRSRSANDVVIDDAGVSRRHALIRIDGSGEATIENLTHRADTVSRAPNPISVNGTVISGETELANGDELALGTHGRIRLRFSWRAS